MLSLTAVFSKTLFSLIVNLNLLCTFVFSSASSDRFTLRLHCFVKMVSSKLKASQWGGSRHKSKPFVDPGLLFRCLSTHEVFVKDLGGYESTNKNSSPDALGLMHVLPFIKNLIQLSRCGEIHNQSMKAALSQLLMNNPEVNTSKFNGTVWLNLRIERIGCILSHYRLLARDKDSLRRCALALTSTDFNKLSEVVGMIVLAAAPLATEAPGLDDPNLEVQDPETATVAYDDVVEETPSKKNRTLRANPSCASNLSVDSSGFPRMLSSPGTAAEGEEFVVPVVRRRLGSKVNEAKASSSSASMSDNDKLRAALGYSTPAAKPSPAKAKGKAKPKSLSKGEGAAVSHVRLPWVKLKRCNAKNPERSYITGSTSEAEKPSLIVEVSLRWSSKYMEITDKILDALKNDSITKHEALDLRKSLCEEWP